MKFVLTSVRRYLRDLPLAKAFVIVLATGLLVWGNYSLHWEKNISSQPVVLRIAVWYGLFAIAFWFPYALLLPGRNTGPVLRKPFFFLLLLAPAIFSLKLALPLPWSGPNAYWQTVLYYPFKLLITFLLTFFCWKSWHQDQPFYGTGGASSSMRPYVGMLLIMVPLIALASLQRDFLHVYPKWQHIEAVKHSGVAGLLLYELSYGSDFVTIELFFRGFLVLAFARYAGKDAILPMAVFYCTIHFGKPLGECISSFFGGILLGVVTYHTRSIRGGLLVHLGIAWLMELGGYLGHQLRPEFFY